MSSTRIEIFSFDIVGSRADQTIANETSLQSVISNILPIYLVSHRHEMPTSISIFHDAINKCYEFAVNQQFYDFMNSWLLFTARVGHSKKKIAKSEIQELLRSLQLHFNSSNLFTAMI